MKERIMHIIEKTMIIDENDEKRLLPPDLLMHLYSWNEYESFEDVITDGGVPKEIIVRIIVSHEEIEDYKE